MAQIDCIWLHWPETKALAKAVAPLRFVGGCVRDALLNREVKDVDAATPLPPEEVMRLIEAAGFKAIPTGIDHGTVTARIRDRHFEITTLRHDVETDGRHAKVAFTDDWKEDAKRRDFTMNALYCDADGQIYDYFGGAQDAEAGHVRFIGDALQRIREDALRILRFFRFFAHYGRGPVDETAIVACGELAEHIDHLSGERICTEMLKLLTSERAADVVGLMQRHGVWPYVVPAVVKGETLTRLPEVLRKTGLPSDPFLSLALLLRTTSNPGEIAESIAMRWKLSKLQQKKLQSLCDSGSVPATEEKQVKKQIRLWGAVLFCERAVIAMAEGAEESSMLSAMALAKEWQVPAFPVSGDDLLEKGIKPGKEMGEKLKALETRWEESGYTLDKKTLLNG